MSKSFQDLPPELRVIIFEYYLDLRLKDATIKTIEESRSHNNRPLTSLAPRKFHITGRTPARLGASIALGKLLRPMRVDKAFYREYTPVLANRLSQMMSTWSMYQVYNLQELRSLCLFTKTHRLQLPQRTRLFCRQATDDEQGQVSATLERLRDIGMLSQYMLEDLEEEHVMRPDETIKLIFKPAKGNERGHVCLNLLHVLGKATEVQVVGDIMGIDWETVGGERNKWTPSDLHAATWKPYYNGRLFNGGA